MRFRLLFLLFPTMSAMALAPPATTLLGHDVRGLRVTLASASPRRRELLALTGLVEGESFVVQPSTFEEDLDKAAFASAAECVRGPFPVASVERYEYVVEQSLVTTGWTVLTGTLLLPRPPKRGRSPRLRSDRTAGRI